MKQPDLNKCRIALLTSKSLLGIVVFQLPEPLKSVARRVLEQIGEALEGFDPIIHKQPSEHAGKEVRLRSGETFRVEDWHDRVMGKSWMEAEGNPAALAYAIRSFKQGLPTDNEVLYGDGWLVHVSEVEG